MSKNIRMRESLDAIGKIGMGAVSSGHASPLICSATPAAVKRGDEFGRTGNTESKPDNPEI